MEAELPPGARAPSSRAEVVRPMSSSMCVLLHMPSDRALPLDSLIISLSFLLLVSYRVGVGLCAIASPGRMTCFEMFAQPLIVPV